MVVTARWESITHLKLTKYALGYRQEVRGFIQSCAPP